MTETPEISQINDQELGSVDHVVVSQPTPPVRSRKRSLAQVNHPLRAVGYYFALVYAFIVFTQLHQLAILAVGVDTHLLMIVAVPMILLVLGSGGLRSTLQWSAAKYWAGYSLFMLVGVLFSTWRSESLALTWNWLRVEVLILFVIAGCVMTWREVKRLMGVLAWAAVVDVVAGRVFGDQIAGRLEVTGTTMSNANDYAALLILVLPCLVLVVVSASQLAVTRIAAAGILLYGLYLILMTGSRGALIGMCVIVLFSIWMLRPSQKIIAGSIVILFVFAAPIIVPQRILTRFSTTIPSADSPENDPDSSGATESKQDRVYLLKQSVLTTLSHPLFGVGAGQFQNYEGRKAREMGLHGSWHETHNTFTQVSSEIGMPALLFFLAAIFTTYRMLNSVYRAARRRTPTQETQQISATAFCLLISLIGFCAASFFLSLGYRFYLPALTGVTIAFYRAVQQKWRPAVAPTENV